MSSLRRALFVKSDKKYQKTPFETHGFKKLRAARRMHSTSQKRISYGSRFWGVMDSFPRRTTQSVHAFTARQNWCAETSPKCCMASSFPSLVRLPFQNVERCTPTFLSGAAAERGAETIPDLHQNAFLQTNSREHFVPKVSAQRRSRKHWFLAAFLW